MYAIIATGGKQYKVEPGQVLRLEKLAGEVGDKVGLGVRRDVPESITKEGTQLAEDMALDKDVVFDGGPIQKTSPVYKIVACPEDLNSDEQADLIQQATTMVIDTFADINQETLTLD